MWRLRSSARSQNSRGSSGPGNSAVSFCDWWRKMAVRLPLDVLGTQGDGDVDLPERPLLPRPAVQEHLRRGKKRRPGIVTLSIVILSIVILSAAKNLAGWRRSPFAVLRVTVSCHALHLADRPEHRLGAEPVRAVRVGKVAGHVDLLRLEPLDQLADSPHVVRGDRPLGNRAGLVEGEVEEVQVLFLAGRRPRRRFWPRSNGSGT